jgi:hypothetical protein
VNNIGSDAAFQRRLLEILSREVDKKDSAARVSPGRPEVGKVGTDFARRRACAREAGGV